MSWIFIFAYVASVLVILLVGGMWVPFAIGVSGMLAIYLVDGLDGLRALGLVTWGTVNSFTLTSIPLFILMAEILDQGGVGQRFYRGLSVCIRGLPGGLMQTNIAGCAMFSAISGSSVATAAAMGTVALPHLEAKRYDRRMAAGSLAAGGTLGILIPPSIPLIIYGTFTETSIVKLFMAGFIPGFLLAFLFMLYVGVVSYLRPEIAPRDDVVDPAESRAKAFIDITPLIVLIVAVLGSIYTGIATPTEGAGIGCAIGSVVAKIAGKFGIKELNAALGNTVRVSCTIIFIVMMAFIFSYAVENAAISTNLTKSLVNLGLGKYGFLVAVVALFLVLGCLLESIAMIVLTIPLLFGSVTAFGFDPVWFAIVMVLLLEIGMLTPPFGINLFVIQSVSKWPLGDIVLGTVPYWGIMLAYIAFLTAFPDVVMWLPQHLQR